MLPRLDIPDWRPPPDGEAGLWEEDTPRDPCRPAGSLPASPSARKTKSRAAKSYVRSNSLRDAKVSQWDCCRPGQQPRRLSPCGGRTECCGYCPVLLLWAQLLSASAECGLHLRGCWHADRPSPLLRAPTPVPHELQHSCRGLRAPSHLRCPRAAILQPSIPAPTLPVAPFSQVLVVSDMHRTESALDPALFQYHQHFESPWQLVGKTSLSEVRQLEGECRPGQLLPPAAVCPAPARPPATRACRPAPTCPPTLPLPQVFRVRHRTSGQVFAVKRSRRRFRSKLQRERCLREIRAVAALPTHPNIVVSSMEF